MTIRAMTADDHPIVCMGLKAIVANEPDMAVVAKASDATAAVTLYEQHVPDVVFMAVTLATQLGITSTTDD